MKNIKHTLVRVIAVVLVALFALPTVCFAVDRATLDEATEAADKLYAKGLFFGYGTGADGKPMYGLEDSATRGQAVVMLVRLLGQEETANAAHFDSPFTDLPAWAADAIGYAYYYGLTSGTSATTFSPNATVSGTEYITFCLRALGYDSQVDFQWDKAAVKAAELGIVQEGEYTDRTTFFSRADMVLISYRTLMTPMKNTSETLAHHCRIWFTDAPSADVAASDLDSFTVPLTSVDAEDPANLLPDNFGVMGYDIYHAPEGTVLRHSELVKNSDSPVDNINHFFQTMNKIDGNVESKSSGYVSYIGSKCGTYQLDGNSYRIDFAWASKVGRNVFLNGLIYFGGYDMGTAVYRMLDEHYRFRSDHTLPISDELAAKYGLTITVIENDPTTCLVNVSNGTDTWEMRYGIPGNEGMGSWTNVIYIPI